MRKVLDAVRRPVRSAVVALALAGVMVFGGTALAGPIARHGSSAATSVRPAAAPTNVKQVGVKLWKLNTGQKKTLLTWGPITQIASCLNLGGGSFQVLVRGRSSVTGATMLGPNGHLSLTGALQTLWFVTSAATGGLSASYDLIGPGGLYQHYNADLMVRALGKACVVRLSATTAG